MDLQIVRCDACRQKPEDESKLGFGKIFTDHMFTMRYSKEQGWYDAKIRPYENFSLSPACSVLHYSQTISKGSKPTTRRQASTCFVRGTTLSA